MKTIHRLLPLLAITLAAVVSACDNPAKDQSRASVAAPVEGKSAAPGEVFATFLITAQNSRVEFTGSKVTGSHDGSFAGFTGSVRLVEGSLLKSSVSVDIDTATLTANPDKLAVHLKSSDFFDVTRFPKASFASTSITAGGDKGATHTITGNLELHGVKKSIAFPATITSTGTEVTATATFSINRKDFGLAYPGMANDLIRDEVLIKLTIRAEKKG
jgi:polyisoprenoid-binding protein YceI